MAAVANANLHSPHTRQLLLSGGDKVVGLLQIPLSLSRATNSLTPQHAQHVASTKDQKGSSDQAGASMETKASKSKFGSVCVCVCAKVVLSIPACRGRHVFSQRYENRRADCLQQGGATGNTRSNDVSPAQRHSSPSLALDPFSHAKVTGGN